jgi:hypothetical protein
MGANPLRGPAAIAGLGVTPQGKVYGTNAVGLPSTPSASRSTTRDSPVPTSTGCS